MSLRLRLTLLYSTLVGGILLIFGTAVYILISVILLNQVDNVLAATAQDIVEVTVVDRAGEVSAISLPALDMTANSYVQVWGRDGKLKSSSPGISALRLALDPVAWRRATRSIARTRSTTCGFGYSAYRCKWATTRSRYSRWRPA